MKISEAIKTLQEILDVCGDSDFVVADHDGYPVVIKELSATNGIVRMALGLPCVTGDSGKLAWAIPDWIQKAASSRGRAPIHKQDVLMSLANAIMWLGKAEPEHVRWFIDQARRNFEQWLVDRPEKKAAEAAGK